MAESSGSDSLARWWRNFSLRSKVTTVSVIVLAIGLFLAGLGTVPWFRQALVDNLDQQLTDLASGSLATRYFDISNGTSPDGTAQIVAEPTTDPNVPRRSDYYVAVFDPAQGFVASAGGDGSFAEPIWPQRITTGEAVARGTTVFELKDENGKLFHAIVAIRQSNPPAGATYIEVVAIPLRSIDALIRTYLSVSIPVAIAAILIAALLSRYLLTLTFRRLDRVEQTALEIANGDFSQRLSDQSATEVGRLNRALNTMLDRVDSSLADRDKALKQMQRFVGDASHELRTPLVTVRGYADLYRMGAISSSEDVDKAMERIEKEAIRMSVMVDDLLALTRLDQAPELKIEPLDLRPIAHDARLDARVASPERVVTLIDARGDALSAQDIKDATGPIPIASGGRRRMPARRSSWFRPKEKVVLPTADLVRLPPGSVPPIVWGEEHKVRQVVTNLLGNARRFTPDDSPLEITVGVDRPAGMGWIAISDHGEGVPPEIREQIFQRFWRSDTSRARETGGSGLGLAIVQSIVNHLHGTVSVTETPGGGATFTVALPLALDAPPAVEPEVEDGENTTDTTL